MHPNYVGQALRSLGDDVRYFAEQPSRNEYRRSMAELEGAKFEAQKPMLELQSGEAKERLRPATVGDLLSPDTPEYIKALTYGENNIEGQPSIADRIMATTGVTKGEGDVLYRDGKPLPIYALRSPEYQQKVSGVLRSAVKADKYMEMEAARLEQKVNDGTATPEETAKHQKIASRTPDQTRAALVKQGQGIRILYDEAARRGDAQEVENLKRDAEYIKGAIGEIDKKLESETEFQRQKELETFKAGLKDPTDSRTSDMKNYDYATKGGFKGTFEDWLAGPGRKGGEGAQYTVSQRIDDTRSFYSMKMKAVMDPEMGTILPGKEDEYKAIMRDMQTDIATINKDGVASWEQEPPKEEPKELTRDMAVDFLKQANGDKEEARRIAREQGYTF